MVFRLVWPLMASGASILPMSEKINGAASNGFFLQTIEVLLHHLSSLAFEDRRVG